MQPRMKLALLASVVAALAACAQMSSTPQNPMSFFVTSANPGYGADLGGLAGADAYCQKLATSVNAGKKTGAPTSAPRPTAQAPPSTHVNASAAAPGKTPKAPWWRPTWRSCTAATS